MCLAVVALDVHADWPLIVIANRDEFHARPSAAMQPWHETPCLLAGRDLQAGGTWLGITTAGTFGLLTNVRDPANLKSDAPSRGVLVENFLKDSLKPNTYLTGLEPNAANYNGFNLIVGNLEGLWHASNYQLPFSSKLTAGVHGLSNALLDTDWPKTTRVVSRVRAYLASTDEMSPASLSAIMHDRCVAPDQDLPQTGLPLERERLLSSPFIVSPTYGTRCTTIVLRDRHGRYWTQEETFDQQGMSVSRVRWQQLDSGRWGQTQAGPGNLNTSVSANT